MTKIEKIIKEWIDLGIDTPFGICNESGYFVCYCVNGIDDVLQEFPTIKDKIEFEYCSDDILKWRPKALKGIEDNNGWIKIESVEDLPKEEGLKCLFLNIHGNTTYISDDILYDPDWFNQKYTHWRIKNEIKDPLY